MSVTSTEWDGFVYGAELHIKGKDTIPFDKIVMPLSLAIIKRQEELEKKFNQLSKRQDEQTALLKAILEKLERLDNPSAKKSRPLKDIRPVK